MTQQRKKAKPEGLSLSLGKSVYRSDADGYVWAQLPGGALSQVFVHGVGKHRGKMVAARAQTSVELKRAALSRRKLRQAITGKTQEEDYGNPRAPSPTPVDIRPEGPGEHIGVDWDDPDLLRRLTWESPTRLAQELGVKRQRIYQVLEERGLERAKR